MLTTMLKSLTTALLLLPNLMFAQIRFIL